MSHGKIGVYALVSIDKRVNDAAVELWLGPLDRIVNDSIAKDVVLFQSNHNSTAASLTLLSIETNAYTKILPWHTFIANNSAPAVFDHV